MNCGQRSEVRGSRCLELGKKGGIGVKKWITCCAVLLGVSLAAFALGRASTGGGRDGCTSLPSPCDTQKATFEALVDYIRTADAQKRIVVKEANGPHEILATRIFRAFHAYSTHGMPFERSRDAEEELLRNPLLTLTVLRPVLEEKGDTTYGASLGKNQAIYLNLCARVASTEADGLGMSILAEVSKHEDARLADLASRLKDYVENNNYLTKGERYRAEGGWSDLEWIQKHYLKPGMRRGEIEEVIGKGVIINDHTVAYHGKRSFQGKNFLYVSYADDVFASAEWGQPPGDFGLPPGN